MTNILTNKQVANAAAFAGFKGKDLQIAVAVANAESGRNADAQNSIDCTGLWQINQPVWRSSHPAWTIEWLKLPSNNAVAAYTVWKASGWGAWSTYTGGQYQKYMSAAADAIANRVSGDVVGGSTPKDTSNLEIGPPSGAIYNPSPLFLKNTPTMSDFYLMGSKLDAHIQKNVISANVDFTTDQVSQITINILDPKLDFISSGLCKPGTPARLQKMDFVVATLETSDTNGNFTVTLKCRPQVVQKLKSRKGTLVMANSSPSDFVKAECKAVGAYAYIQASPIRNSVARDLPEIGQTYDLDQTPSTWTTFQRLAQELGYICFEENGTIYFGQPTYFTSRGKKTPLVVGFRTGPKAHRALSIPNTSKSLDSVQTTMDFTLPLSRAFEARCGRTLQLKGIPEFSGYYMVSEVSFNLAGNTQLLNISAQTPVDPAVAPPPGSNIITGGLNDAGATSDGSWPLIGGRSKFPVTTPYGIRGSWAAGYHTGADMACPIGTPVMAVYDGTVVDLNSWGADYGNHIILKVGAAEWGYCHLSRILVAKGAQVKSGQVIGYSGETGRAFGPHLHLEYRTAPWKYDNKTDDPEIYMMKKGVSSGVVPGGGTKLAADFVKEALTRQGGKYVLGAPRTPSNPNQTTFDCSSLIQWALYQVGITHFPGTTFTQVPYLEKKGMEITTGEAYKTRGALLYRTGTAGGARDHVAISLGNNQTIEAEGTSYGVTVASAIGRGWTHAFRVPGLRY